MSYGLFYLISQSSQCDVYGVTMMHKRGVFAGFGLAFALAATPGLAEAKKQSGPPPVPVTSAIDYSSGAILLDQNIDKKVIPASITKFMTLMITLDDIRANKVDWNDDVRISTHAGTVEYSEGYTPGNHYSLQHLISAAAVRSNNRAVTAVAEHVGNGNLNAFIARMNAKAQEIGMTNTRFVDPSGLSYYNSTTPHDLLTMARYFINSYPEYIQVFGQKDFLGQKSTNKLLYHDFGDTGIQVVAGKTGRLDPSGSCLLAIARRGDDFVIALSMGSPDRFVRDARLSRAIVDAFARQPEMAAQAHVDPGVKTIGAAVALPASLHTAPPAQIQLAVDQQPQSRWPSYRLTDANFTSDVFADAAGSQPISLLNGANDWTAFPGRMAANRNDIPAELGVFQAPLQSENLTSGGGSRGGAPLSPR